MKQKKIPEEHTRRLSETAFAVRTLVVVSTAVALLQFFTRDAAGADDAGVADFATSRLHAIESMDILSARTPTSPDRV